MSTLKVFVVCDRHPKPIAVTNFVKKPTGWTEQYAGKSRDGVGHGVTLVDDARRPPGVNPIRWARSGTARLVYDLRCRTCGAEGSVSVREDRLFGLLDSYGAAGVSVASLAFISASLQRMAGQ